MTAPSAATTNPPIGPPLLGALLRIPVDVIRRRMMDALNEHGFTDLLPAHLIVLRYPGPDGRRPIEIAAGSGMSKQAINYHLGQLERFRYLDRCEDPDDQRSKRVYLTDRGHAAMRTMRQAVTDVEQGWAQELGAEEINQLRIILAHLATIITS